MKKLLIIALALLLCLCSCEKDDIETPKELGSSVGAITTNEKIPEVEKEPEVYEAPIFGNLPNNILQSNDSLCFADGRAYYIDSEINLCSIKLDGTDAVMHCNIGEDRVMNMQNGCLNYYKNGIYFLAKVVNPITGHNYVEIRRFDISSQMVNVIHIIAFEDRSVSVGGMLIINDIAVYHMQAQGFDEANVMAYDLVNKVEKQITSREYNSAFAFDSDGKYLYIFFGKNGLSRVKLADIFSDSPEVEQILKEAYYYQTYIFEDNGVYSIIMKDDGNAVYGFYPHATLAGDITKIVPEEIRPAEYKAYAETMEEHIKSLPFYRTTTAYFLEESRATIENTSGKHLEYFYSPDKDWENSSKVTELYHESVYSTPKHHVGQYGEKLYILLEQKDGEHQLIQINADGTYE